MDTSTRHTIPLTMPQAATRSTIKVRQVRWPDEAPALEAIRERVFINEQNVPPHCEWDGMEQESKHFLAFIDGRPVGTARLVKHHKLTRMAVLRPYRNKGVGSSLLKAITRAAIHSGMDEIIADAQVEALDFYLKHDFKVTGEQFYDAGILHAPIVKKLRP